MMTLLKPHCDELGRLVRETWILWALSQPNRKPSWLVPYDELTEADKEVDRRIGERLFREGHDIGLQDGAIIGALTSTSKATHAVVLAKAVLDFIAYLDIVEDSELTGREFHPNHISSCRVLDGERMNALLFEMKRIASELQ